MLIYQLDIAEKARTMNNLFENNCGLPELVMIMILSYVECIDIVRMRLVFKNWCRSIRHRFFIDFYNRYGPPPRPMYLMECLDEYSQPNSRSLIITKKGNLSEQVIKLAPNPTINYVRKHELLGAINGILCLHKRGNRNRLVFVICNPLTTQMVQTASSVSLNAKGISFKISEYNNIVG